MRNQGHAACAHVDVFQEQILNASAEERFNRLAWRVDDGLPFDVETGVEHRAEQGRAPQLPLEAAIAAGCGFSGITASEVSGLRYISASGGEPPGQEVPLDVDDITRLAQEAREGLIRLIAAFDDEAAPYRALRRARFNYRYDDYAHLARVAEWSAETIEEA
jgi:hypothetical protein